jgi:hypothetical protein
MTRKISLSETSLLQGTSLQEALARRPALFHAELELIRLFSDPITFADSATDRLVDALLAANFVPSYFSLGKFQAHVWLFCFHYFWTQKGSTPE